jgi:hypothetical protein
VGAGWSGLSRGGGISGTGDIDFPYLGAFVDRKLIAATYGDHDVRLLTL